MVCRHYREGGLCCCLVVSSILFGGLSASLSARFRFLFHLPRIFAYSSELDPNQSQASIIWWNRNTFALSWFVASVMSRKAFTAEAWGGVPKATQARGHLLPSEEIRRRPGRFCLGGVPSGPTGTGYPKGCSPLL